VAESLEAAFGDARAAPAQLLGLGYLDEHFALRGPGEIVTRVAERVDPFIGAEAPQLGATEIRAVLAYGGALLSRALAEGDDVVVDASLYDSNSRGRRLDVEKGWVIAIERTGTLCAFLPNDGVVMVVQPDAATLEAELLRTLKALVLAGCERHGCIVVHASGVVTSAGATLFCGDSRNGKTTILLEALTGFETTMLSCDTCVLRVGASGVVARGWPSNFSVSIGTIHDFPALHVLAQPAHQKLTYAEAWAIHPKHVLDTGDVVREMGVNLVPEAHVSAVVGLRFAPAEPTGLRAIDDASVRAVLDGVCLGSRDPLYPNWPGFVELDQDALDRNVAAITDALFAGGVDAYAMTWAPAPTALLRGVATLEPSSRAKPRPTSP
jgi:hypothetical protein